MSITNNHISSKIAVPLLQENFCKQQTKDCSLKGVVCIIAHVGIDDQRPDKLKISSPYSTRNFVNDKQRVISLKGLYCIVSHIAPK